MKRRVKGYFCNAFFCLAYFVFLQGGFAQFQTNNHASQVSCNCFQLTPNQGNQFGSVWRTEQIDLTNSFDFSFQVFLGASNSGADGIGFALQQDGINTLGIAGGNIGIGSVVPSLAVIIDTHTGAVFNDPATDHIAIHANGDLTHGSVNELGPAQPAISTNANIEDNLYHSFRVVWNAPVTTMEVYFDGDLRTSYQGNIVNTIFSGAPMVYWGFVGATGGLFNDQRFCLDQQARFTSTADINSCVGDTVYFTDQSQSTLGGLNNWQWDFGNGMIDSVQHPEVVYGSQGIYPVSISVTDSLSGCVSVGAQRVLISTPSATVTAQDNVLCLNDQTFLDVDITPGIPLACEYSIDVTDTDGNGWQGAYVTLNINGDSVNNFFVSDHGVNNTLVTETINFSVFDGDIITLGFTPGGSVEEDFYTLYDNENNVLFTDGFPIFGPTVGPAVYTTTATCPTSTTYSYNWTSGLVSDQSISSPQTNISVSSNIAVSITDVELGCNLVDSIEIMVLNVQGPGEDSSITVCESETSMDLFEHLGGNPGVGGVWVYNTDTVPGMVDPEDSTAGLYTYILSAAGICGDSVAEIQLNVDILPDPGTGSIINNCENDSIVNLFQGITNPSDTLGIWINGIGDTTLSMIMADVNSSGQYTYLVNGGACGDSSTMVSVVINPSPNINVSVTDVLCSGENNGSVIANATGGSSPYSYSWHDGDTHYEKHNLNSGDYMLTVTDSNGCFKDSTITINQPEPFASITINLTHSTCNSECNGSIEVQIDDGGVPPYSYLWDEAVEVEEDSIANNLCSGDYSVTVMDSNGCSDVRTIELKSLDSLNMDFSLSPDSGIAPLTVDFINGSSGVADSTIFEWNLNGEVIMESENTTFTFEEEGEKQIQLVAIRSDGCSDTIIKSLEVFLALENKFPIVFSPNGDGINDILQFEIGNLESIEVIIYNRWGNEVGGYRGLNTGWDGNGFSGNPLADGTYFYVIKYQAFDKPTQYQEVSGYITIAR